LSTPWEERPSITSLIETIKASFVDPTRFFGRMRVDNTAGALSYYWIVSAFGVIVGQLWSAAFALAGISFGGAGATAEGFPAALSGPGGALLIGFGSALIAPVILFIVAGIIHLGAMIFRSADHGFNATLRSVAYASGPAILQAVPFCGGPIGGIWSLVLMVIGIWKTQRTSVGAAVGAVLLPAALAMCCACAVVGVVAAVSGTAAALFGDM
jgi:hypothetical protein